MGEGGAAYMVDCSISGTYCIVLLLATLLGGGGTKHKTGITDVLTFVSHTSATLP